MRLSGSSDISGYKLEEREEKEWGDGWKTTDQRKTRQARGGFANLKMRTSLEG